LRRIDLRSQLVPRRYRLMFPLLGLLFPATSFADVNKDLQKCRQSQDATSRAACFQKLIPHIDDMSKRDVGNQDWAEALKEAYEATGQLDKVPEAEHRIHIIAGADKLLSGVLAQTNSKTQAYVAVVQYYHALGPGWAEAANRAESRGKVKGHEGDYLGPAITSQITDAVNAVRSSAHTPSASTASTLSPGTGLYNNCLNAVTDSDQGSSSGRHLATVTVKNSCSQFLTFYVCIKSDRAQCWTCKSIGLNPGQHANGPSSTGFGDCASANCTGVSLMFNAAAQGNPPKPNVDDSCPGKAH